MSQSRNRQSEKSRSTGSDKSSWTHESHQKGDRLGAWGGGGSLGVVRRVQYSIRQVQPGEDPFPSSRPTPAAQGQVHYCEISGEDRQGRHGTGNVQRNTPHGIDEPGTLP